MTHDRKRMRKGGWVVSDILQSNDGPNQNTNGGTNDYLARAAHACETGDLVLGMYLYLAAYEKAAGDPSAPEGEAVTGLQEAWHLACSLRERSMAEYVFEKLEPFLMPDEITEYAAELQELALDRLEEFGFSRAELERMTDAIAGEFLGEGDLPVKIESIMVPSQLPNLARSGSDEATESPDFSNYQPAHEEVAHEDEALVAAAESPKDTTQSGLQGIVPTPREKPIVKHQKTQESKPIEKSKATKAKEAPFNYSTLVGYDEAITLMRDFGIGLDHDDAFQNFVGMMNERHGLKHMPALDTVLFRSSTVEDATRFLEATIGELGLPALRMSMEEGLQGMPILCVSTQEKNRPRMNHAQNRFEGPGILVIDDLDMWVVPVQPEAMEGIGGFVAANISRGAREAISLIRSAVEDPRVYVLATASTTGEIDPFFYELLEPLTVIDISNPTETERYAIWQEIMNEHPSMRSLDRKELTRLSSNLARYDIYMAAREAIEEAYKHGLMRRMFVPVSQQNIYDKLAAAYPLDSNEYRMVEEELMKSFRDDLDHLEDLIDETSL